MVSELIKCGLGDAFWASGIEVPVEERHHPVRLRGLEQIRPVYVFLEQGSDPRDCLCVQAGPSAAEEQLMLRTSDCSCDSSRQAGQDLPPRSALVLGGQEGSEAFSSDEPAPYWRGSRTEGSVNGD